MTVKTDNDKIRNTLHWAIGIMISLMIILVGAFASSQSRIAKNEDNISKIQNDYLPYFSFEYIVESNNKLMNILTAIDSKNDEKYQQAIKEWSDLQQEVVKQAGNNKTRGGYKIGGE